MAERRPTNSELRLRRRLTADEPDGAARGILELFDEADEATPDEDAPLARADDDSERS
jgi:hypothetical protein